MWPAAGSAGQGVRASVGRGGYLYPVPSVQWSYGGATVETVELHKWSLHHMPARRGQLVTTGFHVLCSATNTFRGSPFLFNRRYVIIVNLHKKSLYLSCDMFNLVI